MKPVKLSLLHINEKLLEMDERYGTVYPQFITTEMEYLVKFDKALLTQTGLGSQQLRDSAVRNMMRLEPVYEKYHTLLAEVKLIETRMRNLQQISKNLISMNWGGQ